MKFDFEQYPAGSSSKLSHFPKPSSALSSRVFQNPKAPSRTSTSEFPLVT
jgi:hypothetical protein